MSWARTGVRGGGRQVVAEDLSKGVACEPRANWSEAKTWEGHDRCRGPGVGASQRPGGRARRPVGLQESEQGSKTRSITQPVNDRAKFQIQVCLSAELEPAIASLFCLCQRIIAGDGEQDIL